MNLNLLRLKFVPGLTEFPIENHFAKTGIIHQNIDYFAYFTDHLKKSLSMSCTFFFLAILKVHPKPVDKVKNTTRNLSAFSSLSG